METIQAIRKLLFLEDCLIIPGFGGFISQYRSAVIDKVTGSFIPPAKEIVFNQDLVQNDGTLVSFIARENEISLDVAREQVDRFVEEAKKKLEQKHPVLIDGIGQFIQDKSHYIRFQTFAGTNLFLESYGLASFHLREVAHEINDGLKISWDNLQDELPRTVEFVISDISKPHNYRNLRRIAVAMPFLIAFSLLPYNSRVTDTLSSSVASMLPEPSLFRLNYPDPPVRDSAKMIVFPIGDGVTSDGVTSDTVKREDVKREDVKRDAGEREDVKREDVKRDAGEREDLKAVAGKFKVIAGCFKVKSNAERLHHQLVEKGYPATMTTSRNGLLFKVTVESYASRQEALAGLARLKRAEPGLELWVAL